MFVWGKRGRWCNILATTKKLFNVVNLFWDRIFLSEFPAVYALAIEYR